MILRRSLQAVLCGIIGFAGIQLTPVGFLPLGYAAPEEKVTICHIPPGNPANAHTITISVNALANHQSHHGDTLGACGEPCPKPGCDDYNECTIDACDLKYGCVYTPIADCCNKDDDCPKGKECSYNECIDVCDYDYCCKTDDDCPKGKECSYNECK